MHSHRAERCPRSLDQSRPQLRGLLRLFNPTERQMHTERTFVARIAQGIQDSRDLLMQLGHGFFTLLKTHPQDAQGPRLRKSSQGPKSDVKWLQWEDRARQRLLNRRYLFYEAIP